MEFLNQLISSYGLPILGSILTAIAGYLGVKIKSYLDDETKEKVVKNVVKMVEQTYKDLNGQDKYNKAVENATIILNNKGITITEIEIKMLIESACNSFTEKMRGEE